MAKIKFGAFLTDMRGKIGGTIFSRNKGGAYTKNKVTPLNPKTSAQQAQRQLLASFAQAWRTLTDSQRQGWIDGAKDFPLVNVFGDTYTLAGNMLFNRLNLNLAKVGLGQINTIPAPQGVGSCELKALSIEPVTFDLTLSQAVPADQHGLVRVTPGFSAGINNFNNKLRDLMTIDNSFGTNGSILAEYSAKYGAPVTGTKIGVELVLVNDGTGEVGIPTKLGYIVA